MKIKTSAITESNNLYFCFYWKYITWKENYSLYGKSYEKIIYFLSDCLLFNI